MKGNMIKKTALAAAVLMLSSLCYAGGAFPFLRLGAGAAAAGMSGSYSARHSDAASVYWNPSSIAFHDKYAITTLLSFLPNDMRYSYFAALVPSEYGVFGISVINFSSGPIEARGEEDTADFTLFEGVDTSFNLHYAYPINSAISVGITLKAITASLYTESAGGFSFDAGVTARINDIFSAGISMQDPSGLVRWSTGTEEKPPYVMRIGTAANIKEWNTSFSIDGEQVEGEQVTVRTGAEAVFFEMLFIRAGMSYGLKRYDFNYAAGLGFKLLINGVDVRFDYALAKEGYQDAPDLNLGHKAQAGVYF